MRNKKIHIPLLALLCTVALFTLACNRGEEQDPTERKAASPAEVQPQSHELRPEPQSVDVREEIPPEPGEERAEIAARERELAARQALLEARERRLREREQQARTPQTPRPEPADDRRAETVPAPSPEPAPEPAREEEVHEQPVPEEPAREAVEEQTRTATVDVPAGTELDVEFTETLASNTSAPGESFRVRVARDVMEDGEVAIPAGSEILGEVTEAVPLRKVGGQARLTIRFTDLVLPSGATVPIEASFVQQGRSETGKDAATIGGGAAAGAVLGRILNKGNRSKGAVIGAIIGAAAGAAIASKTPGEEVVIPQGSVVSLRLDEPVEVRVSARR